MDPRAGGFREAARRMLTADLVNASMRPRWSIGGGARWTSSPSNESD